MSRYRSVALLLALALASAAFGYFGAGRIYPQILIGAWFIGLLQLLAAVVLIARADVDDYGRRTVEAPGPAVPPPAPVPPLVLAGNSFGLPPMSDAPPDPEPDLEPAIPDGIDLATGELVGDRVARLEEVVLDLGRQLQAQAELSNAALLKLGRQIQRLGLAPDPFEEDPAA